MEKSNEIYQEVARVAYEIYKNRGSHGRDLDDWLEAERIVKARLSEKTSENKVTDSSGKKRGQRGRPERSSRPR